MFSCSSVAPWCRGKLFRLSILVSSLALLSAARTAEPPVIPVGLDAYRHWERWPYQRIGARAYMRSTYDRRGGNEGADASHFLYQLADDFNVTLEVEGSAGGEGCDRARVSALPSGVATIVRYRRTR